MKLLRSENSKHSNHVGAIFACSTIRLLEEIEGFLDPEKVEFHF